MRRHVVPVLLAVIALVFGSAALGAGPARAVAPAQAAHWYLALGDSLAAGYQPGQGDDKTGGYVGQVAQHVGAGAPLTNLACSGETSTSYLTDSRCFPGSSQEAAALDFLKTKKGSPGVITIDIGANDVDGCASASGIDLACITTGLGTVKTNLVTILDNLRAAAPDSQIIVLNYYNPFLVFYLQESTRSLATASAGLQKQLNSSIDTAATGAKADVADVASQFDSYDFTTTATVPGVGTVPVNVARICTWTWMCAKTDIHANDTGYTQLAKVVIVELRVAAPTTTSSPTSSSTSSSVAPTGSSTVTGPPVITDQLGSGSSPAVPILLGALVALLLALLVGAGARYLRD